MIEVLVVVLLYFYIVLYDRKRMKHFPIYWYIGRFRTGTGLVILLFMHLEVLDGSWSLIAIFLIAVGSLLGVIAWLKYG